MKLLILRFCAYHSLVVVESVWSSHFVRDRCLAECLAELMPSSGNVFNWLFVAAVIVTLVRLSSSLMLMSSLV